MATPPKPDWLVPSSLTALIESADHCFEGFAKTQRHFARNGILIIVIENEHGVQLKNVTPEMFSSEIERIFSVRILVTTQSGPQIKQSLCDPNKAKLLLNSRDELINNSLPLRLLSASPVLVERNGACVLLSKGYHQDQGGLYVIRDLKIPTISLPDAVKILTRALFADYDFVNPSDLSRAVAQVLSPAMKLGNFLPGADFPLDIGLGDQSQSGKTLRTRITVTIYGERAYTVTVKKGGVGSLDESIASALCSGKLFILYDNVRGDFESQYLESILRGTGSITARLPYHEEIEIQTDRSIHQFTSNSAKTNKGCG